MIAAIVLWNTVYLEKAVDYLKQQGLDIPEEHLQHLSPLGWEHINLTGDYVWNLKQATSFDRLRPLRVKSKQVSLKLLMDKGFSLSVRFSRFGTVTPLAVIGRR